MTPFVSSQVKAIIEDIRLLEAFVTAPLGLYSDVKMLRESLPFPEAVDLSREDLQERRISYGKLADDPNGLALNTIASLNASLEILERIKDDADIAELQASWIPRARKVLSRAEQKVAGDIRSKIASAVRGLYVIVDPEATQGRPVAQIAEAALKGGASVIQLRDKIQDKGEVLPLAREIKSLCDSFGALFIMNDDADIAVPCEAHGLHVGQTDLPVSEARRILSPVQLVGRSNNGVEEAMESQAQGADYIAVGAVYSTTTMGKSGRTSVGPEMISKVKERVDQPIVAIGGISADNIGLVAKAGADSICVVSAVTFADDPEAAARALVESIQNAK